MYVCMYVCMYLCIWVYGWFVCVCFCKWERTGIEAETGHLFTLLISCRLSWYYSFRERGKWTSSL